MAFAPVYSCGSYALSMALPYVTPIASAVSSAVGPVFQALGAIPGSGYITSALISNCTLEALKKLRVTVAFNYFMHACFLSRDQTSKEVVELKLTEWAEMPGRALVTGALRALYGTVRAISGLFFSLFYGVKYATYLFRDSTFDPRRIRFGFKSEFPNGVKNLVKGIFELSHLHFTQKGLGIYQTSLKGPFAKNQIAVNLLLGFKADSNESQ